MLCRKTSITGERTPPLPPPFPPARCLLAICNKLSDCMKKNSTAFLNKAIAKVHHLAGHPPFPLPPPHPLSLPAPIARVPHQRQYYCNINNNNNIYNMRRRTPRNSERPLPNACAGNSEQRPRKRGGSWKHPAWRRWERRKRPSLRLCRRKFWR